MTRAFRSVASGVLVFVGCLAAATGLRAEKPPAVRGIVVSRETTFITGPLRKDGTVDYLAALNQRASQGVTPENNAVVPLLQAFGPGDLQRDLRRRVFKMLGMAPLPEKGPYLEPFTAYFDRKTPGAETPKDGRMPAEKGPYLEPMPDAPDKAREELERIMGRPWTKADSPIAADWLKENDKQLDLIVAASKRPRFYAPLLHGGGGPGDYISAWLPVIQQSREAARSLKARAMHRIASGQLEEAWQDLLACHRLARLVDQAPMIGDGLVAIAIEGMAIQGDAALTHEGRPTAAQARRFAAEFSRLPPMGKMIERVNWGERLRYLDAVVAVSRNGLGGIVWGNRFLNEPRGELHSFAQRLFTRMLDWSEAMRVGNQWYDRAIAALNRPTRKERDAAAAGVWRDLSNLPAEVGDLRVLWRDAVSAGSFRVALGRTMGRACIDALMPPFPACVAAEDRNTTKDNMVPVVFALAAYRADHGEYPKDLAALVPKYLPAIPQDLFSGGPIRYKRDDGGYVVYSVGQNGEDDGGRASWEESDAERNPDHDDIGIRVPVKKK